MMRQLHMGSLSGLLLLLSTLVNNVGHAVVEFLTWYSNDSLISSLTDTRLPKWSPATGSWVSLYAFGRLDWLRTITIIIH